MIALLQCHPCNSCNVTLAPASCCELGLLVYVLWYLHFVSLISVTTSTTNHNSTCIQRSTCNCICSSATNLLLIYMFSLEIQQE